MGTTLYSLSNDILKLIKEHKNTYAGVDEAGRGCIAGPVVAAAVILSKKTNIQLLSDSKALPHDKRLVAYNHIRSTARAYAISIVSHKVIDKVNILNATMEAMKRAIEKLSITPTLILIDGNKAPQSRVGICKAVVKGDMLVPAISAASILAKVFRDKIMLRYDRYLKNFGFSAHKGYGTKQHYNYLFQHGISPIHRRSFNLSKQLSLF